MEAHREDPTLNRKQMRKTGRMRRRMRAKSLSTRMLLKMQMVTIKTRIIVLCSVHSISCYLLSLLDTG